jgi:tRNA pseudouridine13 synthase
MENLSSSASLEKWQKEQEFLKEEKKRFPELFIRPQMIDTAEILKWIGIHNVFSGLPIGYIKLWPQDFIVEEIAEDGTIRTIEDEPLFTSKPQGGPTAYADLVKVGLSTIEAADFLSQGLKMEKKFIGAAGIKDKDALTSQRISIRNVLPEELENFSHQNLFLKNIEFGKGAVELGRLKGNRFIITVRLGQQLDRKSIEEKLRDISQNGFWNFFYTQRFGMPRLNSHLLGLLILQGNYKDTLKLHFTFKGKREYPYFHKIREELRRLWGNWGAMLELTKNLAFSMREERIFLTHLQNHPDDYIGALSLVPEQIRLWVYAYTSYLFNRELSRLISAGEVPVTLPLALSSFEKDWEPYRELLEEDGILLPIRTLRPFSFLQVRSRRAVPTTQPITIHGAKLMKNMFIIGFTLPKGSYATTFLAHLFTLASGTPVIKGITSEPIDAKELLGLGTVKKTIERFGEVIVSKLQSEAEFAEENTAM